MSNYEGWIVGYGVWILDPKSIESLYLQGFGKGILSRSKPDCFTLNKNIKKKYKDNDNINREPFHAKLVLSNSNDDLNNNRLEPLQLSPIESFYLKDCTSNNFSIYLSTIDNIEKGKRDGKELSIEELWKYWIKYLGIQFISDYCVYCHYRSMGWIVKGGLKYGVNFILYSKGGPILKHGEFAVSIQYIKSNEESNINILDRYNNMVNLQSLSRVTETVAKGLMICLVNSINQDITIDDTNNLPDTYLHPSILQSFSINDYIIKRWEPLKDRE